jgi:hypothetical protein
MARTNETTSRLSELRDRVRAKIHQWRAKLRNMLPGRSERSEPAARNENPVSSETPAPQQWTDMVSAAEVIQREFEASRHTALGDTLLLDMAIFR